MAGQPVPAAEEESASGTAPLPQEGPSRWLVVEAGRAGWIEDMAPRSGSFMARPGKRLISYAFAYTACLFPYRVDRKILL